ncbi:MAG: hypothetical protein AB9866_02855 [Syntrophobacteraceae bacterium]
MRKATILIVLAGVVVFGIGSAIGMHHAVKVQEKQGLGKYFVDAEGKTLYWFKKDSPGKSACTGPCVEKWPLYHRDTVAAPKGIEASEFGTITRDDGKKQTTFRGYPLYYWANDKQPGDTTGQGVNDVWFVIDPGNFPPKK